MSIKEQIEQRNKQKKDSENYRIIAEKYCKVHNSVLLGSIELRSIQHPNVQLVEDGAFVECMLFIPFRNWVTDTSNEPHTEIVELVKKLENDKTDEDEPKDK